MDKQKQIEEMAKVIMQPQDCKGYEDNRGCYFGNGKSCEKCKIERHENAQIMADYLINAGYRKIPENAVVLTREEYDELQIGKDFNYGVHSGESNMTAYYENIRLPEARKETAEKFAELVSQAIVENTYPYFDKDGKPVNIWNAVLGFDKIDEIAKEITEGKANAENGN